MERRVGNIFGFTGGNYAGNVYDKNYMCPTLNTMQGGCKQPMIIDALNTMPDGTCRTIKSQYGNTSSANFEYSSTFGSSGVIVAMRGRNPNNPSDISNDGSQYGTVIGENGISSNLVAGTHGYANNCIQTRYRIRKLTPLESWRLMDFSDEDFLSAKLGNREVAKEILKTYPHLGKRAFSEVQRLEKMSNSQLYKQAGNSIVKNVLVAILGQMLPNKENIYKEVNRC